MYIPHTYWNYTLICQRRSSTCHHDYSTRTRTELKGEVLLVTGGLGFNFLLPSLDRPIYDFVNVKNKGLS